MSLRVRMLIVFLLLLNTTLVVFVANMTLHLKQQVDDLDEILTTKQDLQVLHSNGNGKQMMFAEDKCTRCHTERRFATVHGTEDELLQVVRRMQRMPDAKISDGDIDKIHSSLVLLKCTRCHSAERVNQMNLMTESQQLGTIRRMQMKDGSEISPDEIERIRRAFHTLQGF